MVVTHHCLASCCPLALPFSLLKVPICSFAETATFMRDNTNRTLISPMLI